MIDKATEIAAFFEHEPVAVMAQLSEVRGSSPRAQGTFMLVGETSEFGTIGGGTLEYMVLDQARRLIRSGENMTRLDVPLGPEIGQCCGGRVGVSMDLVTPDIRAALVTNAAADDAELTPVFVFGAGHVGRALAKILDLLPVKVCVVDTRSEELALLPSGIKSRRVAMPEAVVREAPIGSAFVILTHDHALDFLIAQEALSRSDSPYVGMVGSKTKRAKFSSWYRGEGGSVQALERLVLPIGNQGLVDKRPEVIAALAAAEIMVHIGRWEADIAGVQGTKHWGAANGRQ
ncbi:xanthine dehydrogenase accessory protein XdhC [Devosia rhodophyticola]|uniref:Xanthine dehydrogenase accessory protein XdhC n=1 Tax=Devosia rhodophyticola TaxID=3026423 RepID=A0ABY7YUP4_9HYPH|nr:xanthine dehydrogenase accessory protein XdhC [Devosia rhodophyticola]WDR05036.1 xanthine dehydrogenase accessory protein XdhC [Devosia rhodophyticola]